MSQWTGVYTVADVCRILPGMTPRKVHYWLRTGLLTPPLRWGGRGRPTYLSFRQLLEIRTIQHLRDDLDFSLPKVRSAFEWILDRLFGTDDLRFAKGTNGQLIAKCGGETTVVPGGQGVLPGIIPELNAQIRHTRRDWMLGGFTIEGYQWLVTQADVQGGAPTIRGTRIETAMVARLADADIFTRRDIEEIVSSYPHLEPDAVSEALAFEGLRLAA